MKTILITGAAGNLGGLLAEHMKDADVNLHLLTHKKEISSDLKGRSNIKVFKADLAIKESLDEALHNVDVIVHFAGILFKHNPEKFLPITNTIYFKNLLEKAAEHKVKRVLLISFPHVEGETFIDNPASGKLDGNPESVHAKTRLEEEKLLFTFEKETKMEVVSLRVGMVYGKGILMIDAARWFAKYKLLGIWKKPTWIHLISTIDFLNATESAILKDEIHGIYHIGDEGQQTLQEFLDACSTYWGYKKPWHMPLGLIMFAARIFEMYSFIFGTRSPLTRDFVKIGTASYYGDTSRMRKELLQELTYKTFRDGMNTL
jgi:nucleoside-diphosphate-sugar epimerase